MFLIAALAANAVAYGPPSADHAYEAFVRRTLVNDYAVVTAEVALRPNFPVSLSIHRCVGKIDRLVRFPNGGAAKHDGYDCLIEVSPNDAPPYRTAGFFHYDGVGWQYHGPIMIENVGQATLTLREEDREAPNERYRLDGGDVSIGDVNNPLHPDYDPYADVLYRNRSRR